MKKRRGMLGFYVGMGVVIALFIAACAVIGPNLTRMRVWHHMRCGAPPEVDPGEQADALAALVKMGRPAVHILQEYLASEEAGEALLAAEALKRIKAAQEKKK